jgi:hypothetical protein
MDTQANSSKQALEKEIAHLKEKEKKLEHDIAIYREIFSHLKYQFEQMKKEHEKNRKI